MKKRKNRKPRHKHDWRFVSATYNNGKLMNQKKRCRTCGKVKEV